MGTESATNNQNINVNAPVRNRQSSTAKPSPSFTPTPSPVATPGTTPDDDNSADDDNDEGPTPIAWNTAGSTFKVETGRAYTLLCPPDGSAGVAWGSDVYTADSSICTAAVHAGKITLKEGGEVTIEFRGGRSTYGATTRNGITTYNFGEFPHSFVVK